MDLIVKEFVNFVKVPEKHLVMIHVVQLQQVINLLQMALNVIHVKHAMELIQPNVQL